MRDATRDQASGVKRISGGVPLQFEHQVHIRKLIFDPLKRFPIQQIRVPEPGYHAYKLWVVQNRAENQRRITDCFGPEANSSRHRKTRLPILERVSLSILS